MRKVLSPIFTSTFLLFVFCLFLSLSFENFQQQIFKIYFAFGLFLLFLFCQEKPRGFGSLKRFSSYFICLFLLYQLIRFLFFMVTVSLLKEGGTNNAQLSLYFLSPLPWLAFFCVYGISSLYFNSKAHAVTLLCALTTSSFLLAMNLIPVLAKPNGHCYYLTANNQGVFFYPTLYQISHWASQYILGKYGHPNYVGDLIGFGFFSALGLTLYCFQLYLDDRRKVATGDIVDRDKMNNQIMKALLFLVSALTCAAIILLLLSRGTLLCFFTVLAVYFGSYILKFRSWANGKLLVTASIVLFGFLIWAGNLNRAVVELQSLQNEKSDQGSLSVNAEGARRALRIYHEHPFWGVGKGGYSTVSDQFASYGEGRPADTSYNFAQTQSMCHYLHLLAEEGIGAYFYFLFLFAYFIELLAGLCRTRSRFQFLAALSLAAPVSIALMHAAFNHLMQQFSIPMLVYICMGASLAVLRKGFRHQT